MGKYKVKLGEGSAFADHEHVAESEDENESPVRNGDNLSSKVATIGVVVVGAALLETALIPGILLGAAAALAPKYLPKFGERIQPLFNTTVRGAYKVGQKAREVAAEAQEHMGDILAEVEAESGGKLKEAEAAAA